MRVTDRLHEMVDEATAETIKARARFAVHAPGGFARLVWYRAIKDRLSRHIGQAEMVDQVASEMVLAVLDGQTVDEAYITAVRQVAREWRREHDNRDAREQSIEASVEVAATKVSNPDIGSIIPQLAVVIDFDSEAMTHDEWGPPSLVEDALAILGERQRETIELRMRYSINETAEMMGVAPRTVQNAHARARAKMRQALAQ